MVALAPSWDWPRLARHGFLVGAAVYALAIALGIAWYGSDGVIWWSSRLPDPYAFTGYIDGQLGFFYSPAFALAVAPLQWLPEPVFVGVWTAILFGALYAIAGRFSIAALLFPPVALDIATGNVHVLFALVAVWGLGRVEQPHDADHEKQAEMQDRQDSPELRRPELDPLRRDLIQTNQGGMLGEAHESRLGGHPVESDLADRKGNWPDMAVHQYGQRPFKVSHLTGRRSHIGILAPALWAFPLLTKVTPGIGLVWFAVRKEWPQLAVGVGVTAAIVGVSFVLTPGAWFEWVGLLTSNVGADVAYPHVPIPMLYRLPFALAVIAWGARTDRRWTVPVSMLLALPVIWPGSLALLAAIPSAQARPMRARAEPR
jgi:hypothetical protein